jgi:hypothetical protein
MFVEGVHRALGPVLSDTRNLEPVNASATACCSKAAAAVAQREKNFFFEKKFTATLPEQKAEFRSREQTE